MIIVQDQEIWK